jgi:hypothetical protein
MVSLEERTMAGANTYIETCKCEEKHYQLPSFANAPQYDRTSQTEDMSMDRDFGCTLLAGWHCISAEFDNRRKIGDMAQAYQMELGCCCCTALGERWRSNEE